ncbi:DNA helicase [Sporosarcina sp. GW1-11]|uniref:replicative DNA helicase n=1 Tax=Sporosarcina sp. GW1-11 TaxID=2899126 RepID=UPI00294D3DD2|nr:DnaB-like helicase C-terminal domain-containing protein [Sporosarcina sp. GW1-11]MDV6379002.1 DNA helicase [Sporosarcina sp. GW1-11]
MGYEFAEKSLLGSMLRENYLILDSGLRTSYFSIPVHQEIFTAMRELAQAGKSVDYITILISREPKDVGGANYLSGLHRFANMARFDEYKELIIEKWKEQEKKSLLHQAIHHDWSIADIQRSFDKLEGLETKAVDTSMTENLIRQYERPFEPLVERKGTPTGLTDLDHVLNGFQDSEYIVIAGRPSMGKTDALNHFALHAGSNGHLPIVFSLEMSKESMTNRLIAATGEYCRLRMRDPYQYFSEQQKSSWAATLGKLDNAKIHLDDRSGLKVSEIRAAARTIIKANPTKRPIIFIDYLQIIRPEGQPANQTQAIGQISSDLKSMAKEFNCPVVVLSQLSRAVETRQDKRPIMSDLRDSGNIEQDADVVAFLYREDYYNEEAKPTNMLEIQIAKHRNGPTASICALYSKNTGKLYDFSKRKVSS